MTAAKKKSGPLTLPPSKRRSAQAPAQREHPRLDPALERISARCRQQRSAILEAYRHSLELVELAHQYEQQPRTWLWETLKRKAQRLCDVLGHETIERKDGTA